MSDEQYPPRRPTMGHEIDAIGARTRVSLEVKLFVSVIVLTVSGTLAISGMWQHVDRRIERIEERITQMSTKADVERIQTATHNQVDRMVRSRVKRFLVRCPANALRSGARDVECPAVLLREIEEDDVR